MHPVAAQSLFVKRQSRLVPFVIASIVGHAVLVAVIAVAGSAFGGKVVDLDQKPIHATLVRKGKPRDEKLLPRKEELPPPPLAKPAAVPIPGLKPADPSPKQAGEKAGQDRRKQLFGAFNKTGRKVEELPGQEDGDEDGDSDVQEGERYFGLLNAQVRRHYDVSNTIPEQERLHLSALVSLKIGKAGELLEVKLARSSGNDLYDSAVLGAVKKAAPFSPPPDHLRETMADGAIFKFSP
ncbi:MAG: energy transducer TonB [Myxococcaceae bacterium]